MSICISYSFWQKELGSKLLSFSSLALNSYSFSVFLLFVWCQSKEMSSNMETQLQIVKSAKNSRKKSIRSHSVISACETATPFCGHQIGTTVRCAGHSILREHLSTLLLGWYKFCSWTFMYLDIWKQKSRSMYHQQQNKW